MTETPKETMEQVIRDDGRYPPEAYSFLHEGLAKAVKDAHDDKANDPEAQPAQRHVTGRQMCLALREHALEQWGMLARPVLSRWNVHNTMDFGNMVYLLIRHNFMRKTDGDSIEDFRNVFQFEEAFDRVDHFELKE